MLSKLLPPGGNVFLSLTTEKSGGCLLRDRFKSPWQTSIVWYGCVQQYPTGQLIQVMSMYRFDHLQDLQSSVWC